jgi:hypothetical protein
MNFALPAFVSGSLQQAARPAVGDKIRLRDLFSSVDFHATKDAKRNLF